MALVEFNEDDQDDHNSPLLSHSTMLSSPSSSKPAHKTGQSQDLSICVIDSTDEVCLIEENDSFGTLEENTVEANEGDIEGSVDITGSLIGVTRKTVDDMYDLYCRHARAVGFSVRKSTTRFSNDQARVVIGKSFVCSCEGLKNKNVSNVESTDRKRRITRTGCQAFMRISRNDDDLFEVMSHVMIHNHPFTRVEWGHLHRSEREITKEKGEVIEEMVLSGMKPSDSFRYMAFDAGGEENVGHTQKDHMNFVSRWKMKNIEGGDVQTVIEMLQEQDDEEDDFFYKVKTDADGKLANFFWRDSMMKEDYHIYGDVLVFDTTYRTNKYNLICAPFVGINNHWKNVMFGCAFLADEKIETFEWLFKVFRKSMSGKSPVSIFTDQDLAIASAIEKVFPEAKHRLCLWHLQQNAVSRFAQLKRQSSFKDAFKKCLQGCLDEEEFETCWKSMISDYNLENNSWFMHLYSLRAKWCTALSKDFFSAGILSSQRSESTNNAIGFNARKNTSLTEFIRIFKQTIKKWRAREVDDEFICSRSKPESKIPMNGMLKNASEVYTLTIFKEFEAKYIKSFSAYCKPVHVEDSMMIYEVCTVEENGHVCRVIFDYIRNMITCSCKKFEECGYLCYHSLKVFNVNSVFSIPDIYIKKRWTKMAKSEVWEKFGTGNLTTDKARDCILWRHEMTRKYYNLVLKCQGNEDKRRILEDGFNRDCLAINELDSVNCTTISETSLQSRSSNIVLDPKRSVTKGRSKRVKSHFEKKKKKSKTTASNLERTTEFGSITPKVHLF